MHDPVSDLLKARLEAARAGSSLALGELLEAFRLPLTEMAHHQLDSSLTPKVGASDLVQESLMAAALGFPEFRGKSLGEFRVWIAQILQHRAIDLARRFRAGVRDVSRELKDGQESIQLLADVSQNAGDIAAQSEALQQIVDSLNELTSEQRQLIHWRYQDGLSFDEIGKRLGCPRETARRRWYEVIGQIGRQLKDH